MDVSLGIQEKLEGQSPTYEHGEKTSRIIFFMEIRAHFTRGTASSISCWPEFVADLEPHSENN